MQPRTILIKMVDQAWLNHQGDQSQEEPNHAKPNPNGVKAKTKLRNGKDILNYEPPLTRFQARRFKDALLSFVELICVKIDYEAFGDDIGDFGKEYVSLIAFKEA